MADMRAQDAIDRFNAVVANTANGGISWGNNNYPANSNPAWFEGSTAGVPDRPYAALLTAINNQPDAALLRDRFYEIAHRYCRVRLMRIVIYMNGDGGGQSVLYDGTAKAHARVDQTVRPGFPGTAGGVAQGNDATWSGLETWLASMRDSVWNAQQQVVTNSNTVCHSSCHSSCHNSGRGRR